MCHLSMLYHLNLEVELHAAETYQKYLWDHPHSEHTEKIESILMDEINHSKELHNAMLLIK